MFLDGILRPNNIATLKPLHFSQIDEICNLPEWKGIELMMSWAAFEGATAGDALVRGLEERSVHVALGAKGGRSRRESAVHGWMILRCAS